MALGLAAAVGFAAPALADHDHPAKANKFLSTFVRAYNQCAGGTMTHQPPLAFPACTPVPTSEALEFGPKGFGQSKGVLVVGDILFISKFIDVRDGTAQACSKTTSQPCVVDADCAPPTNCPTCSAGETCTNPPFGGVLTQAAVLRATDHLCSTPGACTLIDLPFPVNVPCGGNANPPLPLGRCAVKTTANAVLPGVVQVGGEANIEIQQLLVYNGADLAFTEGIFIP